jgi:ribosome biogenesis GTPase
MSRKKRPGKKVRAEFRKRHDARRQKEDLNKQFAEGETEDLPHQERVSGKGDLTRYRTVYADDQVADDDIGVRLEIEESHCLRGRVLRSHGLQSLVEAEDGNVYRCATRQLLKSLRTEQRHVVVAGDRVLIRPNPPEEGFIERIEPRRGEISRFSKQRRHVIVANVDLAIIVVSAAQPDLKPNLIDRLLVTAEKGEVQPLICINKVDLVDTASLVPLAGVYAQMGYAVIFTSTLTGSGIEKLRTAMTNKQSVVVGQSGVGKSSLLNVIEPDLGRRVGEVSAENEKGKHTTTSAELIKTSFGGYVVDTPGIRQFQLWDVIPEEVAGYYRDLRPFINSCRFPNCTHTHEIDCGVKHAVADGFLDVRRYDSYCHLLND